MIEFLEARIAPAVLISAKAVSYKDADGDLVTVKLSKAVLTDANVETVFQFNTAFAETAEQQLQSINLATLASEGISVKLVAKPAGDGDGFAAVGDINSTGFALGKVKLDGDLGRITAGSSAPIAAKSLTVVSIGRYGIATQAIGGTLDTLFTAGVGKIAAKQDVRGNIDISGGSNGRLGGLSIAGSLLGSSLDTERGTINVAGDIGKVKIGRDIVGGASNSGAAVRVSASNAAFAASRSPARSTRTAGYGRCPSSTRSSARRTGASSGSPNGVSG